MPTTTIVGNWKMNKMPTEAGHLASDIRDRLADQAGAAVVVCPPSIALAAVYRALEGSQIAVGVQNVHSESVGAFTGEISAKMAREFAQYVIVGHSERRMIFGESDEFISRKVAAVVSAGLRPILCVGEPAEVRNGGTAERYVTGQLIEGLSCLEDLSGVLVAYEPVWAIGTGQAATSESAQEIAGALRDQLRDLYGVAADDVPCLYGGSVNADNVSEFSEQPDIDGVLVGSASLAADSFADIVTAATKVGSARTTGKTGAQLRCRSAKKCGVGA